jgi:hypothetical protein
VAPVADDEDAVDEDVADADGELVGRVEGRAVE